uniref:isopeptide-forming domain-containing fimbrial protein n=1 Tax=Enterococcus ureilyticus TaxID=1131292 RepID=UPI001F0BB365
QAALVDQVNDLLTIKDVKVVDETGKDVSGNGRLTTEKNKVQFTLAKKDGSYSYLSGHTYTMTIKTTISEEATEEALAAYSKENGIPNQADLVFGDEGESIHSEKPTVTPPPNRLDKPTVEKSSSNTNSKGPKKIGMFPNTNSTINYRYMFIGLFFIIIVIFFLFMRVNRKK